VTGDLLAALLHPMAAYSCFQHGWSFGSFGESSALLLLLFCVCRLDRPLQVIQSRTSFCAAVGAALVAAQYFESAETR